MGAKTFFLLRLNEIMENYQDNFLLIPMSYISYNREKAEKDRRTEGTTYILTTRLIADLFCGVGLMVLIKKSLL